MNAPSNPAIAALRSAGEHLPSDVRASITSDPTTIPELLAILSDDDLAAETSPGEGWAPIHAVDLLVELGASDAIEPMLQLLPDSDPDEILYSRIMVCLPKLGAPVLEPALLHLGRAVEPEHRRALCSVLASLGVRDERIYRALCDLFDAPDEEIYSAFCFANYGDERALVLLEGAITDFEPDPDSATSIMDLKILVECYESFGSPLAAALREHVAGMEREWTAQRQPATEAEASPGSPPDRRRASAVIVVDTTGTDCDTAAAEALIAFAAPEVKTLGRRRTMDDVQETLLWCAFAWNHAFAPDGPEILELLKGDRGEEFAGWLQQLYERRRRDYPDANAKIGALRTTRMSSGAVRLHVDPPR